MKWNVKKWQQTNKRNIVPHSQHHIFKYVKKSFNELWKFKCTLALLFLYHSFSVHYTFQMKCALHCDVCRSNVSYVRNSASKHFKSFLYLVIIFVYNQLMIVSIFVGSDDYELKQIVPRLRHFITNQVIIIINIVCDKNKQSS